jgi:hypothetical protein
LAIQKFVDKKRAVLEDKILSKGYMDNFKTLVHFANVDHGIPKFVPSAVYSNVGLIWTNVSQEDLIPTKVSILIAGTEICNKICIHPSFRFSI